ncbi:MAG: NAD-dependent deacylase [Candidatus Marinimicrobia bacterium]|nr:NAD-dependent deacylase [Candidatus Neomarinimicrobiota bacterium]HDN58618.1 NAD-dependent deacylase [Candidatus Neomarinimicrobiota bacterium]
MSVIEGKKAKEILKKAEFIAVLTGSGISAESGIPTFRGNDGLWKKFSPEELSSFEGFYRNPAMVTEWYRYRRKIILGTKPNPAHLALADLERIVTEFYLITQNIDRLHQRAGSKKVIELHGNIMENYCIKCGKVFDIEEFDCVYEKFEDHVPRCECGGYIRPNVVWFGEPLPEEAFSEAYKAAVNCEVFISIGTSGAVRPAADLPRYAKYNGAYLIEINPERSYLTDIADLWVKGKAGEVLPQFVEEVKKLKGMK